MITVAPIRASSWAVLFPIPLVPPVTRQIVPFIFSFNVLLLNCHLLLSSPLRSLPLAGRAAHSGFLPHRCPSGGCCCLVMGASTYPSGSTTSRSETAGIEIGPCSDLSGASACAVITPLPCACHA